MVVGFSIISHFFMLWKLVLYVGDGEISFNEFVRVMGERFYKRYSVQEIKNAFSYFDKNGDGFINAEVKPYKYILYLINQLIYIFKKELKTVMNRMGTSFTDKEILRMIKSVDKDGNGQISIEEFTELLEKS